MAYRDILPSWPIRRKLLLLVLAVFLPAAAIMVASGLERRRLEINEAKDNALLMARSLAAQQEQITIDTKQMLSALAQLPAVQELDKMPCDELFRDLKNKNPFYAAVSVTKPDGTLYASSSPVEPGSINIAYQKHIQDTVSSRGFSIGEYVIEVATGVPTLHYSHPVFDSTGNLVSIVIAGFKLDEYTRFITTANLPEGSVVLITDHKGIRLYRLPQHEASPLGKPMPLDAFGLISGTNREGVFERKGDDGVYRIYAFKQLRLRQDSPPYLYMVVGVPKEEILHKANLNLATDLLLLGLAALIAFAFAWFFGNAVLIEPINHLVRATQRLGSGELATRTGLLDTGDELGHLARSFDDMAFLLEAKDRERRKVEEALRESERELRFLSSRLLLAQEEERKKMARELHDGLGGSLSAIKMCLETARNHLLEGKAVPELLEVPIAWTQNLIDEARRRMTELRPTLLDDMGLIATMEWFLRQYRTTYPRIHVEEEIQIVEEDIPETLRTVIFRITQEAFHNIAKHSGAEFVSIALMRSEHGIELSIEDNGEGFDIDAVLSNIGERRGLGLTSMKERAELSGGSFHMTSTIGEGTLIQASWPDAGSL